MKRTIIAAVAGLRVFGGVLASASSLGGVTSKGLGPSTSVVGSCDTDGVTLGYTTAFEAATGTYRVSAVTVSGMAAPCVGPNLAVSPKNTAGTVSVSTTPTAVTGTSQTVPVSPTYDAAAVDNATVLIAQA
jgi:hypothetical protein